MDVLPYILLVLFVIFLVGIISVLRRLRSQEAPHHTPPGSAAEPGPLPASPASGRSEGLETMRLAVEQMDTEHIENLLEMGATLKPGAEDVFREELERRRAASEE